jgi:integrator complex subunit 1
MCITNQFVFPPATIAAGEQADAISNDIQTSALEKQDILTLERHLAAATSKENITESNSHLLSTLTLMNPTGPLRRPPQSVLDVLQQVNHAYRIGHLLCRSRNPDFLLDILQRQGSHQAMPWLADLVESSESSLSILPVQCLCEFLLNSALAAENGDAPDHEETVKKHKQQQLLLHLQNLLQNPITDSQACIETLVNKLASRMRDRAKYTLLIFRTTFSGV